MTAGPLGERAGEPKSEEVGRYDHRNEPEGLRPRLGGEVIEVLYTAGPRGTFQVQACGSVSEVLLVQADEREISIEIDGNVFDAPARTITVAPTGSCPGVWPCGNAGYDDGVTSGAAWFDGSSAGDSNSMYAVKFELADIGFLPGKAEISGFCAANQIDSTSLGGPWPNEVFIYPDSGGMPDDSVVLGQGTIWTGTWEFNIRAIYEGSRGGDDETQFWFQWKYLEERRQTSFGGGTVGWYTVKIDDPDNAVRVSKAIDDRFANSAWETSTETEAAFAAGFAKQIGNIGAIVTGIVTAVFFTMLLVTANTMAQSVRERTNELAVLKTLGFTNTRVTVLVLIESLLITAIGGCVVGDRSGCRYLPPG